MNRRPVISVALILAMLGAVTGNAQTLWVHYNHLKAGNFVITPINLNTASKADLLRLPGVTEIDAQRVIDGRPYRSKTDLLDKKIVSAETYATISVKVFGSEDSTIAR
jgi:DNA uptake protein ComE-like DNA-binding protein